MKRLLRKNNLFFYGLFLFGFSLFIFGCNGRKEEKEAYVPAPCIRKYPDEVPLIWERICDKGPVINGMKIADDLFLALREVGFICDGQPFPFAEEVNMFCEDYNNLENKIF